MPQEIIFPAKGTFCLQHYDDVPLAVNEIRGPTLATLISQGTEIGWANGDSFPVRPGYAAVFEVTEVGNEVSGITIGERRFCMGYHRQTQQCPVQFTLPIPEDMATETALLPRLMGVSMTTLMTTKARPGDKVIVCGAGPVGLLAAHNFVIGGYDVAVVEPDTLRRSQAQQSGITQTFAKMPFDDEEFVGKVALVVDCSGHESAILEGCQIVRKKGEVVLVGVPWRAYTDLQAHDLTHAIFFNFVELRSGWEWYLPILSHEFVWEELLEGYNGSPHSIFGGFKKAMQWLHRGHLKLDRLIITVSPEDPAKIYQKILNRSIDEPFVVYDWTGLS